MSSSHVPPPGKVAIPALRPPKSSESSQKERKKGRTSHACDACRRAKVGCTGEQPCARCKNAGGACIYGDGKREHDRKMMTKLTKESLSFNQYNIDIAGALRRIQLDNTLTQVELRAALDGVIAMSPPPVSPDSQPSFFEPSRMPSTGRDEREASSEKDDDEGVGSIGSMNVINVDTDRDDTRATGHMGKASAVSWAKRTDEEMKRGSIQDTAGRKHEAGFTFSSYHVEDADVEYVDTSSINPYDWPEYSLANILVQEYFDHTHHAFPILDRAEFMAKYRSFVRGNNQLNASDLIWLGTLNVIFAISAVFGDLANREDEGHVDDHLIYCARAKALCMGESFLFQDARFSTISFLGLISLYYISICKMYRAWTICGLAIRNALTLGLHVRSEVHGLSDVEKEYRVRQWWSLYSLEVLLNEVTGRPSCICDRDISTPFPVNIDEGTFHSHGSLYQRKDLSQSEHTASSGSSKGRPSATYEMPVGYSHPIALSFPVVAMPLTSSTFFIYKTQLSIISHEIVTQLYCAATIKAKWSKILQTMKTIDTRLLAWRESLPEEFDINFDNYDQPDWNDPYTLSRIALAISFNSSRMILFRPCLCRAEGHLSYQTQSARDFEQEAVGHCIHSARRMISLLKWNAKSEARFYSISPWWNTLHYLCEALSVLILEMAFGVEHLPNETADILADAKEGIFWLAMLSAGSIAARKAWEIFDNLIRLVAPKIKWSVFDLPTTVPIPARYNWRRFNTDDKRNLGPWSQLSRENMQEHQASHPAVPDMTSAWTNQGYNQYLPERSATDQFGNQLNSTTAIERFTNMGQLYSSYDEPWQQLFTPTTGTPPMGIGGPSQLSGSLPGPSGSSQYRVGPQMNQRRGPGAGERYFTQVNLDRGVGGHETLSPMNVEGSGGGPFEQQDVDMQRQQDFDGYQGGGS